MSAWLDAIGQTLRLGGPVVAALAALTFALFTMLVLRGVTVRRGFSEPPLDRLARWLRAPEAPPPRLAITDEALRRAAHHLRAAPAPDLASARRALREGRHAARRYRRTVTALTYAAPLLGLLGTVGGMVQTFQAMGASGTDPDALAAGIAQALVTTEVGLVAAVVGLLVGRPLDQAARHRRAELDEVEGVLATLGDGALHALGFEAAPC